MQSYSNFIVFVAFVNVKNGKFSGRTDDNKKACHILALTTTNPSEIERVMNSIVT
jgi:hypothetical protein